MGNRIAALALLALVIVLALAVKLLPGAEATKEGARFAPLVLFIETDSPQGRGVFAQFERKLASQPLDSTPRVRFVAAGGDGMSERYREALALGPSVLVASSGESALRISALAPSIPVVFFSNGEPIGQGLVADLNHPGGNRTGLTTALPTFEKRIEILKEAVPRAKRIGVLIDPGGVPPELQGSEHMKRLGVTLVPHEAGPSDERIREAIDDRSIDAWYVPYNGTSFLNGDTVLEALALERRPAIFERAKFADAGGLLAYQHTVDDPLGRMAEMTASVLRGVNAGDIPVVRPQRFELVVNLAAARRLGITLPKGLVKRADRIIDEP